MYASNHTYRNTVLDDTVAMNNDIERGKLQLTWVYPVIRENYLKNSVIEHGNNSPCEFLTGRSSIWNFIVIIVGITGQERRKGWAGRTRTGNGALRASRS